MDLLLSVWTCLWVYGGACLLVSAADPSYTKASASKHDTFENTIRDKGLKAKAQAALHLPFLCHRGGGGGAQGIL